MVSGGFRRELSNEVEGEEKRVFQHFDRKPDRERKETARGTVFLYMFTLYCRLSGAFL